MFVSRVKRDKFAGHEQKACRPKAPVFRSLVGKFLVRHSLREETNVCKIDALALARADSEILTSALNNGSMKQWNNRV